MSKSMLNKILVALIMLAVVLPLCYMGGYFVLILALCVSALAAYEINCLFNKEVNWVDVILTFIFGASLIILEKKFNTLIILMWLFTLYVLYLFGKERHRDFVAYTFLISLIVNLAMHTITMFYVKGTHYGFLVLIYIAITSYGCDSAAYFAGSFFGKHKLLPNVSPNKTWEGAIGGYVVGAVVSFIWGLLMLKEYPISFILTASLILPVVAQIGDLAFSSIKRRFEIKDFGEEFPGHGGIIDRTDSLIFALLCFQCLLLLWF